MTFTIEPMFNQGISKIKQLSDGWTIITADKKLSVRAHSISNNTGVEILTLIR